VSVYGGNLNLNSGVTSTRATQPLRSTAWRVVRRRKVFASAIRKTR
jgi:hypothetical protein